MLPNAPSERLFQALARSLRYADPDVRALPSLGTARVLWTLAQVLGVWADVPLLPAGWLRSAIATAIEPLRNEAAAAPLLRAAQAAARATTSAELEAAARSLGAGLSSVGAELLAQLLGSPMFTNLERLVEQGAPRPSGGAMAADDLSDLDIPYEGESQDYDPVPDTAHTTFDPQGPWVNPDLLDSAPTEGVDWTKVATSGVDAAKDFLTGIARGNYQPPPGTTPQTPADPPRPPVTLTAPPPRPPVTPAGPPAQAASSGGSGFLWGLAGLALLAGGAVAVASRGGRSRRGDVL